MIYLDHGATSFHKPPEVAQAMQRALQTCANPGRGGHAPAMPGAGRGAVRLLTGAGGVHLQLYPRAEYCIAFSG